MTTQLEEVKDGGKGEKKMDEKPWVTNTGSGRERQTETGDDRVVWWLQPHFFCYSLSPGDHPMLSSRSFKRGRLCQSSQIRKTEVGERLYLAWRHSRALWEVKIGERDS